MRKNRAYSSYFYTGSGAGEEATLNFLQDIDNYVPSGELSLTSIDMSDQKTEVDNQLDVQVTQDSHGIGIILEYNSCAYHRESIERFKNLLIKTICVLIRSIGKPEQSISLLMEEIRSEQ